MVYPGGRICENSPPSLKKWRKSKKYLQLPLKNSGFIADSELRQDTYKETLKIQSIRLTQIIIQKSPSQKNYAHIKLILVRKGIKGKETATAKTHN